MKRWAVPLLAMLLAGCAATSPSSTAIPPSPQPPPPTGDVVLLVSSDLHYQFNATPAASSLIEQVSYIDPLLDCFLQEVVDAAPTALLLTGDLTNNGRPQEHQGLVTKLARLKEEGIPVYALPGNHDLTATSREEFAWLYQNCGYSDAVSRDTASLSYLAQLDGQTQLLLLDTSSLPGGEITGGLAPETLAWMESALRQAKADGMTVLAASHHPLLGHSAPAYNPEPFPGGSDALVLLRQYGVSLSLGGHLHKQHLTRQGGGEDTLREVVSGMLADYPHTYSRVGLTHATGALAYQAVQLQPDRWAATLPTQPWPYADFMDFSRQCRERTSGGMIDGMLETMDIPDQHRRQLVDFWCEVAVSAPDAEMEAFRQRPEYALWQRYRDDSSRYSQWLDYLLTQRDVESRYFAITLAH